MDESSVFFTYVVPFLGVLLVAVGIGAAVPGGYAIIEGPVLDCGEPTIAVEGAEETAERFGDGRARPQVQRLAFDELSEREQAAFENGLTAPRGEVHVSADAPNLPAFRNGTLVSYQGERYYVVLVSENPCFQAAPLQFPLGVFSIALGVIGILMPPIYRKLVALERRAS
jgi:hypothetical protein